MKQLDFTGRKDLKRTKSGLVISKLLFCRIETQEISFSGQAGYRGPGQFKSVVFTEPNLFGLTAWKMGDPCFVQVWPIEEFRLKQWLSQNSSIKLKCMLLCDEEVHISMLVAGEIGAPWGMK